MLIKNKNSFVVFFVSLLFGLVLLNLTSRDIFHRFDLTDNKMFSLSNSSESILEKVDDRLTIKVYFSDNLPNELGNTRRYLQDILEEYRAVSKNINFYFYDPESDSELEEQARKDGIQPVQMQSLENDQMVVKKVYLGMVLLYEDKKETLPVIQTTAGLEYMISTKIILLEPTISCPLAFGQLAFAPSSLLSVWPLDQIEQKNQMHQTKHHQRNMPR